MGSRRWLFLPCVVAILSLVPACQNGNRKSDPISGNKAASSAGQPFDTQDVDVSGDGDRARLSGKNNINNPPWDVRTVPPAHAGGTDLVAGRWSGNGYADRVANLALSIPNVTASVAVASGRVLLVGIRTRPQTSVDLGYIQHEIRRRVLSQAPEFRYVYVTDDTAKYIELNRIADGLRSGQPLSGYSYRIHRLMSGMRPVGL